MSRVGTVAIACWPFVVGLVVATSVVLLGADPGTVAPDVDLETGIGLGALAAALGGAGVIHERRRTGRDAALAALRSRTPALRAVRTARARAVSGPRTARRLLAAGEGEARDGSSGEPRRRPSRLVIAVVVCVGLIAVHVGDALSRKPSDRGPAISVCLGLGTLAVAAGLVVLVRRGRPVTRALLALAAGLGAGIEGASVTLAGIVRHGPGPGDVTGLASFSAGLALLAIGGTVLVASMHSWWRLLALPAAFALLLYVALPLAMAVIATHPPAKDVGARTPAEAGIAYREVTVATADGVHLSGWYMPSTNRAAVLTIPGAWSTRSDVLDHALALARHGYGVLDLDPRGHGRSDGTAMDLGWFGDLDVAAGVSFLSVQPDVDPARIGVLGLSMGGEEAIGAAAGDARIRVVVAEGASNRSVDDLTAMGSDAWLMMPAYWGISIAADALSPASRPIALADAMTRIAPRPVLLITASEEPERTLVTKLQSAAPDTTTLWEPAATGHTQALFAHPVEWRARVLGFLDGALLT